MSSDSAGDVERAIDLVRLVLAMICLAVTLGDRTPPAPSWSQTTIVATLVIATTLGLTAASRIGHGGTRTRRLTLVVLHQLDTLAAIGMIGVVSRVAPDSAWVLLVIPIALATLRFEAIAVLITWAGASGVYVLGLRLDMFSNGAGGLSASLAIQRSGATLAVAACLAVLSRWLQDQWRSAAVAENEARAILDRVQVIHEASRSMLGQSSQQILQELADGALGLGFTAVELYEGDHPSRLVRDAPPIVVGNPTVPPVGSIEMVSWMADGKATAYSATVSLGGPRDGISAWSQTEPTELDLIAFLDLCAHAEAALEVAQHQERVRYEASHDALTGLLNRAALDHELATLAARPGPIAVLFIDLDYFKQINDQLGHHIGDRALRVLAEKVVAAATAAAVVARYGGDEIVALLPGPLAREAPKITERLLSSLRRPIDAGNMQVQLSISIGIAIAQGPIPPAVLIQAADQALLAVKAAGRGAARMVRVAAQPLLPQAETQPPAGPAPRVDYASPQ